MGTLTVAVPTRDRPDLLRRCLFSLAGSGLAVLVVDDGSKDHAAVRAAVEAASAGVVRQERRGVSAARNRAAAEARTPFLAFTDDDCVPAPGWPEKLLAALQDGADVAVGPTLPGGGALTVALQVVADAPSEGAEAASGPASNFGCRREVLLAVPFDEAYSGVAAEERDWFERLSREGYRVAVVPDAVVVHHPRLSLAGFAARGYRYGRGAYRFRRRHRRGRLDSPGFYAGLVTRALRRGPGIGLLVLLAQVATATGFVAEAGAALAARSRPGRSG